MSQSQMMTNRLKNKTQIRVREILEDLRKPRGLQQLEMNMGVTRKRQDQKLVNGQIMEHLSSVHLTKLPLLYICLEPNSLHS